MPVLEQLDKPTLSFIEGLTTGIVELTVQFVIIPRRLSSRRHGVGIHRSVIPAELVLDLDRGAGIQFFKRRIPD